jgi:hypothetical protein
MNEDLHPHIAAIARQYARDLGQVAPTPSLDARIAQLVAAEITPPVRRAVRHWHRPFAWAAAAGFAVVAISAGIVIGMRLERSRDLMAEAPRPAPQLSLAPVDLAMWPSNSVALTIPAEYSAQGTLVAVNPGTKSSGQRFWIDVVVSNDGTVRIDRIVPAENGAKQPAVDGPKNKVDEDGRTIQMQ